MLAVLAFVLRASERVTAGWIVIVYVRDFVQYMRLSLSTGINDKYLKIADFSLMVPFAVAAL